MNAGMNYVIWQRGSHHQNGPLDRVSIEKRQAESLTFNPCGLMIASGA
jgi:hypothetical protein